MQALWYRACGDANEMALVDTVGSEVALSYTMGSDSSVYISRRRTWVFLLTGFG